MWHNDGAPGYFVSEESLLSYLEDNSQYVKLVSYLNMDKDEEDSRPMSINHDVSVQANQPPVPEKTPVEIANSKTSIRPESITVPLKPIHQMEQQQQQPTMTTLPIRSAPIGPLTNVQLPTSTIRPPLSFLPSLPPIQMQHSLFNWKSVPLSNAQSFQQFVAVPQPG